MNHRRRIPHSTRRHLNPPRKHRISRETLSQKTQLSGSLSRTRTLNRVLRQHPVKHLSNLSRNLRRHLHRTTASRKRTRRHQQLMKSHRARININRRSSHTMRRTLRSHIPRSTRKRTRRPRTRRTSKRSNTEISHTNLLIQRLPQNTAQQNILRLNIQMHHALTVSELHRIQNLHHQTQRQTNRQRTLRSQLLTQRTAMLKLHHQS